MPGAPLVELMGLADTVICDRIERKWSMVGMFNQIFSPEFPCLHPKVGVYARLADIYQPTEVHIQLVNPHGVVISTHTQLIRPQPHRKGGEEIGGYLTTVRLNEPGRYMMQLIHGRDVIGEAKLDVIRIPTAPEPGPGEPL